MCGVESCGNWCVSWFCGLPLDGKHGRSNGEWAGNMGLSFWTEKRGNDKNDDDDEMMTRTRMWSFWAEVADFCMPTVQTSNGQGKEGATYGFWLLGQAKIGAKMSGPHIPIFKFFIEILMKNWITIRAKIEGVQKKLFSNNGKTKPVQSFRRSAQFAIAKRFMGVITSAVEKRIEMNCCSFTYYLLLLIVHFEWPFSSKRTNCLWNRKSPASQSPNVWRQTLLL